MKGAVKPFFTLFFSILASLFSVSAGAQSPVQSQMPSSASSSAPDSASEIVKWDFSSVRISGNQYTLILKGHIRDGWRLFSTTLKDDQPNSRVTLDSPGRARIVHISEKGALMTGKDTLFGEIRYFEKEVELAVDIQAVGVQAESGGNQGSGSQSGGTNTGKDIKGSITFMAIRGNQVEGPQEVPFRYSFNASGGLVAKTGGLQESASAAGDLKKAGIDLKNPVGKCGGTGTEDSQSKSLAGIFLLGFLGGLVGLIMPCTFPMIPLTVSFFTKKSGTRSKGIFNAFMYGFFIFLIYVLLSLPFYFLKASSSGILNNISTNIWLNIGFAVVFFAFALSFFGLFEITLPSSVSNSVDSKSSIGSLGGIFFMALTLAIVSFSCTGPILGSLLVGAFDQNGGAIQLSFAMGGFGLALGLPFALFALFPSWLQSLPRSGGWMTTVKIVFGFVELALALKYLSNADLVSHWGLLKRETFFAGWIGIGIALVLYLFGILKFRHDPPPAKLSKARIGIALLFVAFVCYLLPGVTNTPYANRALISGFPPPLSYSIYGDHASAGKGVEANVMNDYEKALQLAREQHKPLLIDFTGWACVNCRKMEENVWPRMAVKDLIQNDFILVSLYVDDRKSLPDDQQFLFTTSDGSKKPIKTIGDKFATLQSENFKNASQPLYVVISPDEKLMNFPVGYTPDPKEYAAWLRCGLDAYKKSANAKARE